MESPARLLKIFLCHASADKPAVRKLYRYLRSKGMDPWLDAEKLLPGQMWQTEIPKALYASDAIIVVLSQNSITKEGYVQREIKFALDKALDMPEGRIFLIPARLEECEVPESLKGYQWVDLFRRNWNRRLMSSLNERIAQLGLTPLSTSQIEVQPPVTTTHIDSQPISSENAGTFAEEQPIPIEISEKAEKKEEVIEHSSLILEDNNQTVSSDESNQSLTQAKQSNEIPKVIQPPTDRNDNLPRAELDQSTQNQPTFVEIPKQEPRKEKKIERPEHTPLSRGESKVKDILPHKSREYKKVSPNFNLRLIGGVAGALLLITLGVWVGSSILNNLPTNNPSPTSTLGIGSTMVSDKDGMTLLYVPPGEFTMGSNDGNPDEKPAHTVYLDAYWIDKTEVTNTMYVKCVQAKSCTRPSNTIHFSDSKYANHPVVSVSWNDANKYCSWAGRRLSNEAEWEKAARSTDGRTYPWGNNAPNNDLVNYNNAVGDTTEVNKYPNAASPYGILDMAGNVSEWVADWYGSNYYSNSPYSNPSGPDSGTLRVYSGGSWYYYDSDVRSSYRGKIAPDHFDIYVGFRCALSENKQTGLTPSAQFTTKTAQPVISVTPSPIKTTISPIPTLGIGSTKISDKDGMTLLYVPAGKFTMGIDYGPPNWQPIHKVTLDAFWIDKTEVTLQMYSLCVEAGVCKGPTNKSSNTHSSYYGNGEFDNYPVIYVDWNMAKSYCQWASRRLPTEAEWEKAARGTNANINTWGNDESNNNLLNDDNAVGDTTEVGKYPNGASPYGALDMEGNVWEWVADWFDDNYYASLGDDAHNPQGPVSGQYRVLRGGSWYDGASTVGRRRAYPLSTYFYAGFRCAMDAAP